MSRRRAAALGCGLLALALLARLAAPAGAQQAPEDAPPIEIEADMLEVDREAGTALFSGSVRAAQEGLRLHADRLQVFYGEDGAGGAEITRLEASGHVLIDSDSGQTAQAQWAVFEVAENRITLGDKVSLLQGENIIEGGETVMDLATGEALMRSGGGERVRGLFVSGNRLELTQPLPQ